MRTLADFLKCKRRLIELGLIAAEEKDLAVIKKAACLAVVRDQISESEFIAGARPPKEESEMTTTTKATDVYAGSGGARVKSGAESYVTTKSVGTHHKTGRPVLTERGTPAELPSQLETAQLGAFIQVLGRRTFGASVCDPSDHARDLVNGLIETAEWGGTFNGEYERGLGKLLLGGAKALLDESGGSGGLEAAPIVFDQMLITTPLLSGEIYPYIQVVDIPRGRRVEGASIANVTLNSGGADNVEIPLFNTAAFIAAFDTTIFACDFACELGADLLSDSPLNLGSVIQTLVSEKLAAWLDEQVLSGDATTEPEGIFAGSGTTSVASDNGSPGPWTLGDFMDVHFGVGKVYRRADQNPMFFSNDTVFARSRAIKVDPQTSTTDQRPVMSTVNEVNTYTSLGWRHGIQNDLSNRRLGFGAMRRYRMYRRTSFDFRLERGGNYLARKNLILVIARSRWGGQMANPDGFAKITDGQT